SLIRAGAIEEIIMVGIYNTDDRLEEYTDSPLGRSYASFVVNVVKPLVDSTYRTMQEREHTGVIGSSMGGLISILFAAWHPEVFSMAAGMSSSIGPGLSNAGMEKLLTATPLRKDSKIYFDVGELEPRLIPGSNALAALLDQQGFTQGVNMEYVIQPGAVHNELAWSHRLWKPLVFMFGTPKSAK
ncbi:MAG TPA: alpha/beta hydrolase-fold protein, partial [Bacteroidota bacterium]|nr:alpha/beta hydrolase-fold protein [Bacteroidota bacterium]